MFHRILILAAAGLWAAPAAAQLPPPEIGGGHSRIQSRELAPAEKPVEKPPEKPPEKTAAKPAEKSPAPPADAAPEYNTITLQGLNKVTGHISTLEGPTGTLLRFGNLEIIARRCWKAAPEERPENAALLDISELKPGEPPQSIFVGWMFSSSPGLSGLEHPVYDITVISCEQQQDPETEEGDKKEPEKKEPEKKSSGKKDAEKKEPEKKKTN